MSETIQLAKKLSLLIILLAFISLLLLFPSHVLQSAMRGVAIWWDILFPALFPFFVLAELMLGFGIVHFFGTLLDPMMRPLFRVPGIGGFVMAMGFASGYPVSARLTSQLWEQGYISREEGERLVSFTSTSDPIFMIGAVAVGFFFMPSLALILVTAHYGGGVLVGLLMRFHARKEPLTQRTGSKDGTILIRAFRNMHRARLANPGSIGILLRDAVESSLKMIFVIGGLVVFFSVLIEICTQSGVLSSLNAGVSNLLFVSGIPTELSNSIVNGLFEVTLGSKSAGAANSADLIYKAAAAALVLSWSGLSVHAQIVSLMSHTGMRYRPFLFARIIHGLISAGIVFLTWDVLGPNSETTQHVLPWLSPVQTFTTHNQLPYSWVLHYPLLFGISMLVLLLLITAVPNILLHIYKNILTGAKSFGRRR